MLGEEDQRKAGEVTLDLRRMRSGDEAARERVFTALMDDLSRRAQRMMPRPAERRLLQTGDVLNEACRRLMGADCHWLDRNHFLRAAALTMKRILIDEARRPDAPVTNLIALPDPGEAADVAPIDVLALNEALDELEQVDPMMANVVMLRYYGSMTRKEIAAVLDVSVRTVTRSWGFAQNWLQERLATQG